MKYPYDILIIGAFSSWFLGTLFFLFQLPARGNIPVIIGFAVVASLILLYKSKIDQFEDQDKRAWVESFLLLWNLVTIISALTVFLITFSEYWFAKELRYFSVAFGLPALIAMIYWMVQKNRRTMS